MRTQKVYNYILYLKKVEQSMLRKNMEDIKNNPTQISRDEKYNIWDEIHNGWD